MITCQEVIINALQRLPGLLVPCMVVPPAVMRVAEVLCEDQECVNVRLLAGVSEDLIYLNFLVRQSAIATHYNIAHTLVCSLITTHPRALSWLTARPKADLHPFPPLSHRKVSHKLILLTFLACPSKKSVFTLGSAPVMWTTPPHLCDPSETINLQMQTDL